MADDIYMPDEDSSAPQLARWVLMLSHLYYDRGVSLVDDADYDAMCAMVADRWDELDEHLQVQLGSPEEIRTTGMGVWLSRATIGGAESLAERLGETLGTYKRVWEYECECCGCDLTPIRG